MPGKPGARKRPPTVRRVPWAELGAGRVQVEFGRPGAAPDDDGPDDTDSSDDIDEDINDDSDIDSDDEDGQ